MCKARSPTSQSTNTLEPFGRFVQDPFPAGATERAGTATVARLRDAVRTAAAPAAVRDGTWKQPDRAEEWKRRHKHAEVAHAVGCWQGIWDKRYWMGCGRAYTQGQGQGRAFIPGGLSNTMVVCCGIGGSIMTG